MTSSELLKWTSLSMSWLTRQNQSPLRLVRAISSLLVACRGALVGRRR